jgi:hypothetical protein
VLGKLQAEKLPRLQTMFGDSKYNNRTLARWMEQQVGYRMEVSSKPSTQDGFVPLKVRWVVELAFAWLGHCRHLSKDDDSETAHSET